MLRKFLCNTPSTSVLFKRTSTNTAARFFLASSCASTSSMIKPSSILFNKKSGEVGFKEEDVPSDMLKNPVWDREDADGLYDGDLGGDETMNMSESEWDFFESLQLLSEEELNLLEKDTLAAKKGGKK